MKTSLNQVIFSGSNSSSTNDTFGSPVDVSDISSASFEASVGASLSPPTVVMVEVSNDGVHYQTLCQVSLSQNQGAFLPSVFQPQPTAMPMAFKYARVHIFASNVIDVFTVTMQAHLD